MCYDVQQSAVGLRSMAAGNNRMCTDRWEWWLGTVASEWLRSLLVRLRPERLLVAPGSEGLALLLDLPEQMAQVGIEQALEVQAENPTGELAPPREAAGGPGAPPAAASQG